MLTQLQKCLLWLSSAEVPVAKLQELLKQYESVEEIWEAFGKEDGPRFQAGIQKRLEQLHSNDAMEDLIAAHEKKNVHLLFQSDEAYPQQLREIDEPPYLLYYAGRLECLQRPMVAIVGTRRASSYGQSMSQMLARGLAEAGICVVSGLARGIDACAHRGALEAGGQTVGILGSGINVPYPPEHTPMLREIAGGIGLVLSEYPLDAEPCGFHFPYRNRIISGLSLGVIFVEGRVRSGGMHTVSAALSQGREVFAVPGHVGSLVSEGPHTILREGARIVTSAQDVLDDLGFTMPDSSKTEDAVSEPLTPQQEAIIELLQIETMGLQELSERLNVDNDALITDLGFLVILGRVRREAGNRFSLPISANQ